MSTAKDQAIRENALRALNSVDAKYQERQQQQQQGTNGLESSFPGNRDSPLAVDLFPGSEEESPTTPTEKNKRKGTIKRTTKKGKTTPTTPTTTTTNGKKKVATPTAGGINQDEKLIEVDKKHRLSGAASTIAPGTKNVASRPESPKPDDPVYNFATDLANREDDLLRFVAKVGEVYQKHLDKKAPFMTYVLVGMQSSGKSTIMERFLGSVLNIVQEGTGTRCPLDITCIHDDDADPPICKLEGDELPEERTGDDLSVGTVFECITEHNRQLASEDRFSVQPIYLVYRSKIVENIRFVDTPGIISNKGTGKDNRNDVKDVLLNEMRKRNNRLCVLLEPKEFETNPIIDFCDSTLGGRDKWIQSAIFLMTKFDKQMGDSQTGSKTNRFFRDFFANSCFPYLVVTPNLKRENYQMEQLFQERVQLLDGAEQAEMETFTNWQKQLHEEYTSAALGEDELLHEQLQSRIGFTTAKKAMREVMLMDTIERLPEVVRSLRETLGKRQQEKQKLQFQKRLSDSKHLKQVVENLLIPLQKRIVGYLDGDLTVGTNKLQTLEEEVREERESDWQFKKFEMHSENEEDWRKRIPTIGDQYPDHIQPKAKLLGGKQYQRALDFCEVVMVDSLRDPFAFKAQISNALGFLSGGIVRENWEQAMVKVTRASLKDIYHPSINYLIKHVGCIFRRLFTIAMEEIKKGSECSAEVKHIPGHIERHLFSIYDDMLWTLLEKASTEIHSSIEPMYSYVDPALPTFQQNKLGTTSPDPQLSEYFLKNEQGRYVKTSQAEYFVRNENGDFVKASEVERFVQGANGQYTKVQEPPPPPPPPPATGDDGVEAFDERDPGDLPSFDATQTSTRATRSFNSNDVNSGRRYLKTGASHRVLSRTRLLSDFRSAMVTEEEKEEILQRSFEYIVALFEFNVTVFKFQVNHRLYNGFKEHIGSDLSARVGEIDWDTVVKPDASIQSRLDKVEEQIKGLSESLHEVKSIAPSL